MSQCLFLPLSSTADLAYAIVPIFFLCARCLKLNLSLLTRFSRFLWSFISFQYSLLLKKQDKRCCTPLVPSLNKKSVVSLIVASAPEILQDLPYGPKVDVFSSGVILYTMLAGFPPFRGQNVKDILKKNLRQGSKNLRTRLETLLSELKNLSLTRSRNLITGIIKPSKRRQYLH